MIMTGRPKRAMAVSLAMMVEAQISRQEVSLSRISHLHIITITITITIMVTVARETTMVTIITIRAIRETIKVNSHSSRIIKCLVMAVACNLKVTRRHIITKEVIRIATIRTIVMTLITTIAI